MSTHTLSVLVENKPGVLARIAGLFSRRGFNIDSLAVGPTEHPEISRMTVVVDVDALPRDVLQLRRLDPEAAFVTEPFPAYFQEHTLVNRTLAFGHEAGL